MLFLDTAVFAVFTFSGVMGVAEGANPTAVWFNGNHRGRSVAGRMIQSRSAVNAYISANRILLVAQRTVPQTGDFPCGLRSLRSRHYITAGLLTDVVDIINQLAEAIQKNELKPAND